MTIQVKRSTNLNLIRKLNDRCLPDHPLKEGELSGLWWVAYKDGRPVGFASAILQGKQMVMSRSGVLPRSRGMGIQRMLINARVRFAVQQRVSRVLTYVSAWNIGSMRNLLRCGFKPYCTESNEKPLAVFIHLDKMLTSWEVEVQTLV